MLAGAGNTTVVAAVVWSMFALICMMIEHLGNSRRGVKDLHQ